MVSVGIIGGTGYTGKELIRLISKHPRFKLDFATSRSKIGEEIIDVHPNLQGLVDLEFISPNKDLDADLVFCAVPHTRGMEYVPELRDKNIKVVDLSADYRIRPSVFEEFYEKEHSDIDRRAVYGLTEYNRNKIKESDFVANPGCFPTGAILSVLPILESDFEISQVLFDSKTGISGAGAQATETTHFSNVEGEVSAYNLISHRHTAEIKRIFEETEGPCFGFTPHIVPLVRGILTTTHVFTNEEFDTKNLYEKYYSSSEFVKVNKDIPKLKSVKGTNYVNLGGFESSGDRLVILSSIDNLVKGASGQAIQNANLMMGFEETLGLKEPGLAP